MMISPKFIMLFSVVTALAALMPFSGCGDGRVAQRKDATKQRHCVAQGIEFVTNRVDEVLCNSQSNDMECSLAIARLEEEIRMSGMMCTNSGFRTSSWAFSVANRIRTIDEAAERRRLTELYFDQLARINPFLEKESKRRERILGNFVQLLEPYEALLADLKDPEKPFELMRVCLVYYNRAIQEAKADRSGKSENRGDIGQRQWKLVGRRDLAWNYEAGLARFALAVTNNYLPRAKANNQLGDRYEYWQKRLREALVGRGRVK